MKKTRSKNQKAAAYKPVSFLKNILDFEDFNQTGKTGVFKVKTEGKQQYISLLAISGIDIFHYTDEDMESVFRNFAKATIGMKLPHKYVFTHQTPYFGQQKEYLEHKISKTTHPYSKELLQKKLSELEGFEANHKDRLAYLIVFADSIDELEYSCTAFVRAMSDTDVETCQSDKAVEFFNSYLCFGQKNSQLRDYRKINSAILPEEIEFMQNCFKIEDSYITSVNVNDYPANILDLELASIVSQYDCTITFDVMYRPKQEVLGEVKQSLKELKSRSGIKQEVSDSIDTQNEFEKLTVIYNELTNGNEQMLYTTLRFFVAEKSYDELVKSVRSLRDELESKGISTFVPINTIKQEYVGMSKPSNEIQNPYPLQDTYKRQFPFYYQSHTDPSGLFFGYTDTHGLNVFNSFYRNTYQGRDSYDLLAFGMKGSGKSVTLKSMLQDQMILGNKVMVLDIEDEYKDMAKIFNGQTIEISRQSCINPLQIRMTVDYETENEDSGGNNTVGQEDIFSINFTTEVSRITTFLTQLTPSISDEELSVFRDILIGVYADKGITDTTDITGFANTQFPVMSDVLAYIRIKKENPRLTDHEIDVLISIEMKIKQLAKGGAYGSMFDNYTNVDVEDKNLIVFNCKNISELNPEAYNAVLFNILSLMWSEICKNRVRNKQVVNSYDRKYIVALIDEAHRFISYKNTQTTDFIEKLLRRSRKYDAGLWFASQSILDFLPSGNSEAAERIKIIFQLVQYKVILKQSSDSIETLCNIFSQFTYSELKGTSQYSAGEMLLALSSGRHKLHCRRTASDSDLMYIGNSQDRSEIIHRIFSQMYTEHSFAEYGKILARSDVKAREDFIRIFTSEVFQYLGIDEKSSDHLYEIVNKVVTSLCIELVESGKGR